MIRQQVTFAIWIGKSCSSRNGKVLGFCDLDHQCSFPLLAELEGSIRRNIFEGQDDISFAVNGAVILRWFSPILQAEPLGGRIIKDLSGHGHHHLAKEIITTKHITVPNRYPHGPTLNFITGHDITHYNRNISFIIAR